MKTIAFILAFIIFGGSVKSSPLIDIVKTTIGLECSHSLDTVGACHSEDSDTQDNCCGDMDCGCTCCVHIMILTACVDLDFIQESFADSRYGYVWDYQRDYLSLTFHPPA